MRSRARRVLTLGLAAPIGLELLYLIAANLVLATGTLTSIINKAQHDVVIRAHRAWTYYPGHLAVRGFSIDGVDTEFTWRLTADRGDARLSLLPFRRKVCRLNGLDASGLAFSLHTRPKPLPSSPSDPSRLWRVELLDTTGTDIREIEIDGRRVTGPIDVGGDFVFWPTQELRLSLPRLVLRKAGVALKDAELAGDLEGTLRVEIPTVDLTDRKKSLLSALDLHGHVEGRIEGLAPLRRFLGAAPWLVLDGGRGRIDADVSIEKGAFAKGTNARVISRGAKLSALEHVATGTAVADFVVRPPVAALELKIGRFSIRRAAGKSATVRGKDLRLSATSPELDLARAFQTLELDLDLGSAEVPELKRLSAYFPKQGRLAITRGKASLRGSLHVRTRSGEAKGKLSLAGKGVALTWKDLDLDADLEVDAKMSGADLGAGSFVLDGSTVRIRNARVAKGPVGDREEDRAGWYGDLVFEKARLTPDGDTFLEGDVVLAMKDLRPFLAAAAVETSIPKLVRGLLAASDTHGRLTLELGPERFVLEKLHLTGTNVEAFARAELLPNDKHAAILLKVGNLSLGIEVDAKGAHLDIVNPTKAFFEGERPESSAAN